MEIFLTWSGWLFGLVSVLIAFLQFKEKEKLKKEITKIKNKTENYSSDNGSMTVGTNKGGINFGKK